MLRLATANPEVKAKVGAAAKKGMASTSGDLDNDAVFQALLFACASMVHVPEQHFTLSQVYCDSGAYFLYVL